MQLDKIGGSRKPLALPVRRRGKSPRANRAAMRATQATPRVVDLLRERIGEELIGKPLELGVEEHSRELTRIARQVSGEDFYGLLGVKHGVGDAEIHDAYTRLARLVHPAHAERKGLGCRREILEMLFNRITSSYVALSDGDRRNVYDRSRQPATMRAERDTPDRRQEKQQLAERNFRLSVSYLKMMDFSVAIDLLREAVRLDPQPHYYERLAQAQAKNPQWLADAVESYHAAVGLSPNDVSLRLGLAQMLERNQDPEGALAQYQEVAKLDPDNGVAIHALATHGSPSVNAVVEAGTRLTRAVRVLLSGDT